MAEMATMTICGKNLSKVFFSGTSTEGHGHLMTFEHGSSDFKSKTLSFSETTGPVEIKFHMTIYFHRFGVMTKMAALLYIYIYTVQPRYNTQVGADRSLPLFNGAYQLGL